MQCICFAKGFNVFGYGLVCNGKFTIKAADDLRTINKNVHFRPPNNCYCINELASLWESKVGRKTTRVTVSDNDLLAAAAENRIPESIVAAFTHDIFIRGCQLNFPTKATSQRRHRNSLPRGNIKELGGLLRGFWPNCSGRQQDSYREKMEPGAPRLCSRLMN